MNKTKIPYLTHTWNPIAMKCSPCSPACENCWHLAMAKRMAKNPKIAPEIRAAYAGEREPILVNYRLGNPRKVKSPSIVGTQFMGDLWHEKVPFQFIDRIWIVMDNTPHFYLVLTKRPERMKEYWDYRSNKSPSLGVPFSNVALGVTVENQKQANRRIHILLQVPARWHWVSYEPALGTVDFSEFLTTYGDCGNKGSSVYTGSSAPGAGLDLCRDACSPIPALDAIIAGCESGPNRRPSNSDWFRSIRDQCQSSGTSFFLKQMDVDGKVVEMPELDGQVWDQLPWRQNENQ